MKKTKKLLSAAFVLLILLTAATIPAFATTKSITVSLRIEGVNETFFNSDVIFDEIDETENVSVAQLLQFVNDSFDDVNIVGADMGYVTEVNGEKTAQFNGWDGWYYAVNGSAPSVGISDYTLSDGDDVVLYYGDYPCYIPQIDTSWFSANGTIKFSSTETTYDYDLDTDTWIETTVNVPVADMTVILNDTLTYITDENGEIKVDLNTESFTSDKISLQVKKYNLNGAPAVLRYAPDFTIDAPKRNVTLYGDVNKDGKVNIKDATLIQLYLANFKDFDIDTYIIADFSEDYNVNILDVTLIQLYLAFGTK